MRVVLISLCFVALAVSAQAQERDQTPQVLDQVYACANVSGEAERLACYDAAVGRLREAQNTGNLVAVDRQQAQQIEREAFGFSLPNLPRIFGRGGDGAAEELAELQMTIARVEQPRGGGAARIVMTNGQVWTQSDGATARGFREGRNVTVRNAALGTFLMSVEGGGAPIRVRRSQ